MNIEDMFTKFWFSYPTDLCRNKRGGKQPAFQSFKKINPDEAELKRMLANMDAQARADRKDKDAYRWPFVSTYLNQRRYDDVIETQVTKEVQPLSNCTSPGCNNAVHGSAYAYCSACIPCQHDERLKKAWKATKLDRRSPTLAEDCRAYILNKGFRI